MSIPKAMLVVGAGDATGGAIARRFAREGYTACVARRTVEKLAQKHGRYSAPLRPGNPKPLEVLATAPTR